MSRCHLQRRVARPWGHTWLECTEPHVGGILEDHVRAFDDDDACACPRCLYSGSPGGIKSGGVWETCDVCQGTGCVECDHASNYRGGYDEP